MSTGEGVRTCRECGCTDHRVCVFVLRSRAASVCSWVEDDLCSACVPDIAFIVGYPRTAHRWKHAYMVTSPVSSLEHCPATHDSEEEHDG